MRWIAIVTVLLLVACGSEQGSQAPGTQQHTAAKEEPLLIYAVNYPLAWAAQQLVGESAEVALPLPADIDPPFWEPTVAELAPWQQADLVLRNGAAYAAWLDRVSLRASAQIDTSAEFRDNYIAVDTGPVHSHGPGGEHSHSALAFTLWLDLDQYSQQVGAIARALAVRLPQQADTIEQRSRQLRQQLAALDQRLKAVGQSLNGAPLLYSHPVFQYFERAYDLNGRSLHWEPGQVPDNRQLATLDKLLQEHPARLMLWEDEPLADTRALLDARGITVVVFRPVANRPADGDFLSMMEDNVAALEAAYAAPPN